MWHNNSKAVHRNESGGFSIRKQACPQQFWVPTYHYFPPYRQTPSPQKIKGKNVNHAHLSLFQSSFSFQRYLKGCSTIVKSGHFTNYTRHPRVTMNANIWTTGSLAVSIILIPFSLLFFIIPFMLGLVFKVYLLITRNTTYFTKHQNLVFKKSFGKQDHAAIIFVWCESTL